MLSIFVNRTRETIDIVNIPYKKKKDVKFILSTNLQIFIYKICLNNEEIFDYFFWLRRNIKIIEINILTISFIPTFGEPDQIGPLSQNPLR